MSTLLRFDVFTPAIHLVYARPALPTPDETTFMDRIAATSPGISQGSIRLNWAIKTPDQSQGEVTFGDHRILFAGQPVPLPSSIVDHTIHVSPWQPQIKAAMRQHQSHLSLVYAGSHPDPVEQMVALCEVAHAFQNEDLLGIVNEQAWTAHPPADFLTPERIESYRQEIPFILWVGYVKFYLDPVRYWLVTKGHHLFDVPDLAALVESADQESEIIERLIAIFYYLYDHDVIAVAGDTVELQSTGERLRLAEVPEELDLLMGPSGTLVVKPFDEDGNTPTD
jgi:hypothetical protein